MVSHEKVKMLIKDKQGKEGLLQFAVPIPDGTWEEIELNLGEAVNNWGLLAKNIDQEEGPGLKVTRVYRISPAEQADRQAGRADTRAKLASALATTTMFTI